MGWRFCIRRRLAAISTWLVHRLPQDFRAPCIGDEDAPF